MEITLTIQQKQILNEVQEFLVGNGEIFILKGYAGTGKTTLVKYIVELARQYKAVKLMAPTGRAARVLADKTGYKTTTIHKAIYASGLLVEENTHDNDIADAEFRLYFPIQELDEMAVAIVDEASMVSAHKISHELLHFGTDNLMEDLLTYIRLRSGGKVIFIGDPAQLPPVGEPQSQALDSNYFRERGLRVMEAELTEVIRQGEDSIILQNAMQLRNILQSETRNRLVFEEKDGEVEQLTSEGFLPKYLEDTKAGKDTVIISYSNRAAAEYNRGIRSSLYGEEEPDLRAGDKLMVVQNNYMLNRMNGEFIKVLSVGEHYFQSAPVYVQENGIRVRKVIEMEFVSVEVEGLYGMPDKCLLILDFLLDGKASLSIDLQRALYINFCMRHAGMKRGSIEFAEAIKADHFYNALRAKYGYAVTGHKCQGGEWDSVFVDYSGRTGLDNDSIRWAYTATTRAKGKLYFTNLPHITPYTKFRMETLQSCSKINSECRVLDVKVKSPFHRPGDPDYLHAKWACIQANLKDSPYSIVGILSKPYQEIYTILTPDGPERYDIRYKKGGIFQKASAAIPSHHSTIVCMMLNSENAMPLKKGYVPTNENTKQLYNLMQSCCDAVDIPMTNVVEHPEEYSIIYYFRTSDTHSYIKFYINGDGFVTYAMPMSLIGTDDGDLVALLEELNKHFV